MGSGQATHASRLAAKDLNEKVATPGADKLRVRPLFASAGGAQCSACCGALQARWLS